MKNNNKVSVVCAYRLMQSVYAPILKFAKDMQNQGYGEYVMIADKFVHNGILHCTDNDINGFIDVSYSFTLNNIAKEIVNLHSIYFKKYGDNFFLALKHIFECLLRDMYK